MRILFTTPVLEFLPAGGPQLRIANSIKILAGISELHVISRQPRSAIGGEAAEGKFRKFARASAYSPSATEGWARPIGRIGVVSGIGFLFVWIRVPTWLRFLAMCLLPVGYISVTAGSVPTFAPSGASRLPASSRRACAGA